VRQQAPLWEDGDRDVIELIPRTPKASLSQDEQPAEEEGTGNETLNELAAGCYNFL
jgi:hypothetical protein